MKRTGKAEQREIRRLMEAMRDEFARECGADIYTGNPGDWSSRTCGKFGALLYQRARALANSTNTDAQTPPD